MLHVMRLSRNYLAHLRTAVRLNSRLNCRTPALQCREHAPRNSIILRYQQDCEVMR
jgi:hypothetical protein